MYAAQCSSQSIMSSHIVTLRDTGRIAAAGKFKIIIFYSTINMSNDDSSMINAPYCPSNTIGNNEKNEFTTQSKPLLHQRSLREIKFC